MLTDLRKSINYIIYERTTSPFWGSFIFSWLICNWKIVLTIFVISEDRFSTTKTDYISQNLVDWKPIAFYPFVSTIILVSVFPLLGNGAYWITLKYAQWRLDQKNLIERQQLLSIEKSIELRNMLKQKEDVFNAIINDKETEIQSLKIEIDELNKKLNEPRQALFNNLSKNNQKAEMDEWDKDYDSFKTSSIFNDFQNILIDVNTNRGMGNYITPKDSVIYFQSIGLIKRNSSGAAYELTDKGLHFSRIYNKNKFEK